VNSDIIHYNGETVGEAEEFENKMSDYDLDNIYFKTPMLFTTKTISQVSSKS
jgi:hypothetical protein